MKTDMKAMRPDEFIEYVIKNSVEVKLGSLELILTAMRYNTEFYEVIGLSNELAMAINGLCAAREEIKEIIRKLPLKE